MLRFFRFIRQKLLSENKFSKYVIYAVGEILLVIIGILIALQINNRAELRKTEAKIDKLFENVLEELDAGIESTTELGMDYFVFDSLQYIIDDQTIEDYKDPNKTFLFSLTTRINSVQLNQDAFDNLMANRDDIPTKYEEVTKKLIQLYEAKSTVDTYDEKMDQLVYKTLTERSENYEWFAFADSTHLDAMADYLLNDFRYKNEVVNYRIYGIFNQLYIAMRFRIGSFQLYEEIAELLGKSTQPDSYRVDENTSHLFEGDWININKEDPSQLSFYTKNDRLYVKSTDPEENSEVNDEIIILGNRDNDFRVLSPNFAYRQLTYAYHSFNQDTMSIYFNERQEKMLFVRGNNP